MILYTEPNVIEIQYSNYGTRDRDKHFSNRFNYLKGKISVIVQIRFPL